MANNYTEGSAMLLIPKDKDEAAQAIIDRVTDELENSEEWECCCVAELHEGGVWFHANESLDPEHVAVIARALIDELEIDEPFFFSWAYTCSKPRLDEFGGGAFVIKRGYETAWVDAMSRIQHMEETGALTKL